MQATLPSTSGPIVSDAFRASTATCGQAISERGALYNRARKPPPRCGELPQPETVAMNTYIAAAALLLIAGPAGADGTTVAPPNGAPLILEAQADGVQIYTCENKDKGPEWVFKAPEANLFDARGQQIGTHFAGPSWKLTEGSSVTGTVVSKAEAPVQGAIPWLLLKATTHEGSGVLTTVSTIRRTDTKGGSAPAAGCNANHLGDQVRMRYSATYQFFGNPK